MYLHQISHRSNHPNKAFELLRTAMMQEQVVAVAKTVLGTKETLLTLIPRENGLLIQTMFYADEVKALPQGYSKPPVVDAELAMAKQLISGMVKPFAPEEYKDEYQERLRELIATKIAGKEVVSAVSEGQPAGGNVIDLMEALQKSIELYLRSRIWDCANRHGYGTSGQRSVPSRYYDCSAL